MVDPEVIDACAKAQAATDAESQNEQVRIIQENVHENVSYLPLIWRKMNFAYTKGLENFQIASAPTYAMRGIRLRTN